MKRPTRDGDDQDESDKEWTAFESSRKTDGDNTQTKPPQNVSEWEMWYPCPNCQSTELIQIIESHLSVSATEDGSYGGEQGGVDEYNYVKCEDCEEVLLDEIGRDQ